jgi:two-component system chemotaxis response regulator CheB
MRDTIVIGASAGGIEAICRVLSQLPADLPAVILVALHISPTFNSVLPAILTRCGKLPADAPSPGVGERLAGGRIYVVRPDHHLAMVGSEARAVLGPRINGHRPAINVQPT